MKNFKKLLALVVAMVMIIGTMSMSAFADATGGAQSRDTSVSISGLEAGDSVYLYQIIKWVDGSGWALTDDFKDDTACQAVLTKINEAEADDQPYELTEADVNAFTTVAKALATQPTATSVSGDTFTQSIATDAAAGSYLALIKPVNPSVVYNPIIVSADWATDNETESMVASSENLVGDSAVAKKTEIEDIKEVDVNTQDDGGTFNFTIKTTIPAFADVYTNKYFKVHDTLDDYLDLTASSIHVYKYDNATKGTEITAGATTFSTTTAKHSFDLDFTAWVSQTTQPTAQPIIIEYSATLNVPKSELTNVTQLDNDSYVEFPNNPLDDTGKSVLKDDTRQYTFTIDGSLFGNDQYRTGELVKVGVDQDGNWIEETITLSNGTSHAALSGAEFGVYTSKAAADAELTTFAEYNDDGTIKTDGLYTNSVFTTGKITTDAQGEMTIEGLDEGTYWIKELKAPAGYIRDTKAHSFQIIPEWGTDEEVTEYFDPKTETWSSTSGDGKIASTYTVKTLKSYTVKVDGTDMATYSWTNQGGDIQEEITINESSFEVKNTQGVELPSTGGVGTTIFYIVGAVLVLGAGILLVTRRRMNAN